MSEKPHRRNDDVFGILRAFDFLPAWVKVVLLYAMILGLPGGAYLIGATGGLGIKDSLRPGSASVGARVSNLEVTVESLASEHQRFRQLDTETRDMVRHVFCSTVLDSPGPLEFQRCLSNVEEYMRRNRPGGGL